MPRVMLFEDDPLLTEVITHILQRWGHHVSSAENGKIGVRMVNNAAPDLVITDLIMPDQEGIETIRQLRSLHPTLPIIAISGSINAPSYLAMAAKLGARRTLLKPFEPTALLDAVQEVLHGSCS